MKENAENYKLFEESVEMYKNIISNVMDLIIVLDLKGNFLYVSPQIYNISGFKQEELIGKSGFNFMHPDDIKKAVEVLKEAIERGKKVYIEYRTIHKKGYYVDVAANGRIVNMEGEDRVFAIVRDISEKKKSQQKLKESEENYKTLSNELEDIFDRMPATVFRKNRKGVYTQVNQSFADGLNLKKEDIIGKTSFDFFPSDQAEIFHEDDLKVMRSGEPQLNEMGVDVDGETRRLIMNKIPQFNTEGEVIGLIGITTDISQQIAYEQELFESEKRCRQLIEDSLEGVWVIDEYENTTLVNSSMARILGYKVDEMMGKNLFDFTAQDDIETTKNTIERRKKGVKEEIERKFIRKDGKEVVTRLMASPIFDNNDVYRGAIAFISDITERKKTENLLKESEEKFRNIAEQSFMGINVLQDGLFKYFNEKAVEVCGYSREEIKKWKPNEFAKIFHPDDKQFVMEQAVKKQEGDPDVINHYQLRIIRKDEKIRWIDNYSKTIRYEGSPADLVMIVDITDKIKAEQRLKESEEKFRTLFEIAPASITVSDFHGNINLVNQKFCELHGVKDKESLKGRNIREFFIESDLPKLKAALELSSEGKSRDLNYYTMLKEDGREFLAEAISKGIKNKNGEITGLIGVAQDITDREKAAQELRESEEKFRIIAEQSFMGVLIIQEDNVEYVNEALLDMFEFTERDIKNWSKLDLIKLIEPNDLQYLRDYRNKLRQGVTDTKPYYSYRVYTKSGKKKWIDQFSKEITYKGKPAELVTIMDITEKKEAEQKLLKLNSLKSELLRRTSHELKTPLVSIKGYSDLLLSVHKETLDDYVLASIVEIKKGCERLENLIKDILNTAELESGVVQLNKVVDDLSFFIKLSVMELEGLSKLRNQTINLNLPDRLITSFETEQMHQVISNIINNAIKYTPPDGTIEISSEVKDHFIIVSIKDSGIGITKEEKERLFTQFGKIERYGQGIDLISDGSGLGLYISKKIVELHGGKIWVESEGRNKGSTFYFSLPIMT